MKVEVNGEQVSTSGTTLAELLDQLEISREGIAVAVGLMVVPTKQYAAYSIKEGDEITVIRPTKGG